MRKKLLIALLGLVASFMMTTAGFAEDVYVTKYGKKYHKEGSRFIKNKEVIKMAREDAEEKGYEPSKDFLKKEVAAKEDSEEQKTSEK